MTDITEDAKTELEIAMNEYHDSRPELSEYQQAYVVPLEGHPGHLAIGLYRESDPFNLRGLLWNGEKLREITMKASPEGIEIEVGPDA